MANSQNLIPNSKRTESEVRENTRKGGIKSGESRRRKKLLKELLEIALDGKTEFNGQQVGRDEAIVLSLIQKAEKGDVSAFLAIRDTLGEKPTDTVNVEMNGAAQEAYEKAAQAIKRNCGKRRGR